MLVKRIISITPLLEYNALLVGNRFHEMLRSELWLQCSGHKAARDR